MKERIDSFDFMRSITAFIIVIYHFAGICYSTPQFADFPCSMNMPTASGARAQV